MHTCMLQYSTSVLRSLGSKINITKLNEVVLETIRDLGIGRKTRRGTKAGQRKQRSIKEVRKQYCKDTAVNPNNLTQLQSEQQQQERKKFKDTTVNLTNLIQAPTGETKRNIIPHLKMCSVNCRSVRNKADYLNDFITENDYDCVAITESWLSSTEEENEVTISALVPSSYKLLHVPRQEGRGGGVAFICKNHYKTKLENGFTARSFESMTVVMNAGSFTLRFVIIYRVPPSPANKLKNSMFLEELSDYLESVATLSGKVVLVGDFNVHWDNPQNTERIELATLLDSYDLKQHVEGPTHTEGHTLDLLITHTSDNLVRECKIRDFVSDHNAVDITFNCCKDHPSRKTVARRNLKSLGTSSFTQDLDDLLTGPLPESLDDLVCFYNTSLVNLLDKHAPIKERQVVDRDTKKWMTDEILIKKRQRRKAEQKWRKTRDEGNRQEYKLLCDEVKDLVQRAKSEFYVNEIKACEGDQKKLYKVVDTVLGRYKPEVLPTADSNLMLAERFNCFFTSKIATIRQKLSDLESTTEELSFHSVDVIQKQYTHQMNEFEQSTEDEIAKIVTKSSKATCSLDALPTPLVKENVLKLAPIINKIVNKSLTSGKFPSQLKSAIVRPLLKKSSLDSEELKNYRPVSNLSFVSKVIEKVIASRLIQHMEENNLLDAFQSAYKSAHSTESALLRVHNDIMCAVDQHKGLLLILLDLSAAFDTVDHNILMSFLENHIGIGGTALNLLRSYLSDRTQCVSINGVFSELSSLAFGVPQGSVLGPIIFCTYTLPVGAILRKHGLQYHIYADDTQVYCTTDLENTEEALKRVSQCISDIRTWMIQNKLKINDDKTEFLFIRSPKSIVKENINVKVGSETITPSSAARNLGVMFDEYMNMNKHIASVCKSAHYQLRNIRAIRALLPYDAAAALVHALITSKLDYCNSILYGLPDKKINLLQRIQNIAARIIAQCPKYCHITPVLKELHWLPVEIRIQFKIALFVYRCINNQAPGYLAELVKTRTYVYETRSLKKQLLHTPRSKLTYGDRSFSNCGPYVWNTLPLTIRQSSTIELFKKKLKTFLFQKHFGLE